MELVILKSVQFLINILYILEAIVNLILQEQIHQKSLYLLSIIINVVFINNKSIFAQLIENNHYIMDNIGYSGFVFLSINKNTLKSWHWRLGYREYQNIN